MENKQLHSITYLLVIIGAINWGLMGLFDVNLVNMLLGSFPTLERLVYILVGVSAVVDMAMLHKWYCKVCGDKKGI